MLRTNSIRNRKPSVNALLEKTFLEQKLNNWLGFGFVVLIALVFGYLIATKTFLGLGLFGMILGLFVVMICMLHTEAGLYINLVYSFFAFHFSRFLFQDAFPVGVITDLLIVATLFSFVVKRQPMKASIHQFVRKSMVVLMLLITLFLGIELFNPYAGTFEGWFQTIRRFIGSLLLLFIAYNTFTSYQKMKRFLVVLFVLCVITGLYGCIQEWHGLFDFELAWVTSDANRYGLYFIMGDFRKFSTMSDPTAYGIAMASCVVFYSIIAWNQKKLVTKAVLIGGILIMFLGMLYSGTRTANVMIVGGVGIFVLLTLNKRSTQTFAVVAALIFAFLMYGPYVNSRILRFRSSFIGSEDASYKVREENRAFIQPYMYSHPIGGGLGTTGAQGLQYSPGHYLAGFPPDSGYLKKALETGWIGLALIIILYYLIMKFGITGYFRSRKENRKLLFAASASTLFTFYIAEFGQVAIGQITDIVIYYPIIAMMLKLREFDKEEQSREQPAIEA